MSSECQFVSLLQRIINSADCLGFSARVNRQNNSTQLFTSTKLIFKEIKISFKMNFLKKINPALPHPPLKESEHWPTFQETGK